MLNIKERMILQECENTIDGTVSPSYFHPVWSLTPLSTDTSRLDLGGTSPQGSTTPSRSKGH